MPIHKQIQDFSRDLNKFYLDSPPLWQHDDDWNGFSWICHDDYLQSVIAFRRIDDSGNEIIIVCNFVPVKRENYRIGVPYEGYWEQILSTDDVKYGGTGMVNNKKCKTEDFSMHGYEQSITLDIPPLSAMFFKHIPPKKRKTSDSAAKTAAGKKKAPAKTSAKTKTASEAKPAAKKTTAGKAANKTTVKNKK